MATLSGGHLAVDFASGSVPALLPFFVLEFDLSYTATAVLMLAVLASSSFVQPLFGLWSDRRGAIWLLPAGVALSGAATGLAAVAPSYGLIVVLVFLAGIGIAAYHPEGAKFAAYASGRKRASGMSLFNIGGNTGYALGPIVVTPLVLWLGLEGGLVAMLPILVAALFLLRLLPTLAPLAPSRPDARHGARRRRRARNDAARRGDRAPERGLVRVADVRAALGRGRRRHGRGGQPRALADARRRRRRDARARARRRSRRASADAAHHAGRAAVPDRRVRRRGRCRRHGRADARRPLRGRHVRDHDGAEPALPAARTSGWRAGSRSGSRWASAGSRPWRSARSPTRSTSRPRSTSPLRRRRSAVRSACCSRGRRRGTLPRSRLPRSSRLSAD